MMAMMTVVVSVKMKFSLSVLFSSTLVFLFHRRKTAGVPRRKH